MTARRTHRFARVVSIAAVSAGALMATTPVASAATTTAVAPAPTVVAHLGTTVMGGSSDRTITKTVNIAQEGDYRVRFVSFAADDYGLTGSRAVRVSVNYDYNPAPFTQENIAINDVTTTFSRLHHFTKGQHTVVTDTSWAVGLRASMDLVKG